MSFLNFKLQANKYYKINSLENAVFHLQRINILENEVEFSSTTTSNFLYLIFNGTKISLCSILDNKSKAKSKPTINTTTEKEINVYIPINKDLNNHTVDFFLINDSNRDLVVIGNYEYNEDNYNTKKYTPIKEVKDKFEIRDIKEVLSQKTVNSIQRQKELNEFNTNIKEQSNISTINSVNNSTIISTSNRKISNMSNASNTSISNIRKNSKENNVIKSQPEITINTKQETNKIQIQKNLENSKTNQKGNESDDDESCNYIFSDKYEEPVSLHDLLRKKRERDSTSNETNNSNSNKNKNKNKSKGVLLNRVKINTNTKSSSKSNNQTNDNEKSNKNKNYSNSNNKNYNQSKNNYSKNHSNNISYSKNYNNNNNSYNNKSKA